MKITTARGGRVADPDTWSSLTRDKASKRHKQAVTPVKPSALIASSSGTPGGCLFPSGLVTACDGDDRPDCPILDDLAMDRGALS